MDNHKNVIHLQDYVATTSMAGIYNNFSAKSEGEVEFWLRFSHSYSRNSPEFGLYEVDEYDGVTLLVKDNEKFCK